MAPPSDSGYFPSLRDCILGECAFLSWSHVSLALSDESGRRQTCAVVAAFLADEYVQNLLRDPCAAFAPPSEDARKEFETKTAPIEQNSTSKDKINLDEIKRDAEWLSKNANINLIAALRVAVAEIQSRPAAHLMSPLSTQDATNLQEAAGLRNGQGASFLSDLGAVSALDADEISADFDKPNSKKRRLFDTLLIERRAFMMTMDYMTSVKIYGRLPIFTSIDSNLTPAAELIVTGRLKEEMASFLPAYLKVVSDCMKSIESGLTSLTDEKYLLVESIEIEWLRSLLIEVIHALSVVFQISDSMANDFAPSGSVNQWFSMMDTFGFFESMQPIHPLIVELILPLKTLSSAISISLLRPARSLAFLAEREEEDATVPDDSYDSYLLLTEVLEQIHKSVVNAASADCESATPVIFTWTLLLHRMNISYQRRTEKRDNLLQQNARENFESGGVIRPTAVRRNSAGSIFSIESSKFDGFLESTSTPKDFQLVEQLANSVTAHGTVFEVIANMSTSLGPSAKGSMTPLLSSRIRSVFMELLKVCFPLVGYQSEPVGSLLALLAPGRDYWDLTRGDALSASQDIVTNMMHDDHVMEFYFQQSLERFPYEFLPFVTLCRRLCTASMDLRDDRSDLIFKLVRRTPNLTFTLPDDFSGYELVLEDENSNSFCLTEELSLISLSSSWSRRWMEDDAYRLPVGTYGRFITDTGRVFLVEYAHSTLSLLGRLLEINLRKEGYRSELGMLQADELAEAIFFLSTLLRLGHFQKAEASSNNFAMHKQRDILHEVSKHISGGKDIVTIVCETMDHYMQDELTMAEDAAVRILNACITFLDAVLPVQPNRVCSYLARSELFNSDHRAGKLSKVTGVLDLGGERFDFLMSSLSFFSDLVDCAMNSAVQRRAGNKAACRQKLDANPWLGTADKVLTAVSLSIARASVDVLESTSTWRFDSTVSRSMMMNMVVPVLENLVLYSYSTGTSPTSEGLTDCLRPAASFVVDCFMSPAMSSLRFGPILSSFSTAFLSPSCTLYPERNRIVRSQLCSVLNFCTTLLRTANYVEQPSTMLETYLFKSSTLLARLSASSDLVRAPVIRLLEALVTNAGKSVSEPPSLLGYLGPQISRSFLQTLADVGKPFALTQETKITWSFLSSTLKSRQQWMSNCLLTGQTPREAMRGGSKGNELKADSVFARALAKLKRLKEIDKDEALAILDFIKSAKNYWPWTVFTLLKDTSYIDGLRAYVRDLQPASLTVKTDAIRACIDAKIAAYAAETLAMQLYHSRHQGMAGSFAKDLMADIDYYLRDGVEAAGCNQSLHGNLAKNFANKYFGCSVELFKRTVVEPGELGSNYYYHLDRADDMLKLDAGWRGRNDKGFKDEMKLANGNLSLVDAQIALFHGWEFLLVELSTCLPADETLAKQMLQVAQQCLSANQSLPGSANIFLKLVDARAKLALILVQRLVKLSISVQDVNQLLTTLLATIQATEEPYSKQSIPYYRTLLKTLFVTLRAYQISDCETGAELDGQEVKVTQMILNVLDQIVGKGFRTLIGLVHEQDADVWPEDLALLNAILQACLSLRTIDQSQTQILNIMAAHDAFNAAASLYSWADHLSIQGDPVYGELSILFLRELSSLPALAEQLACDGILSNLLSANLSKYMLKTKLSPYGSPVAQRCYSIWAKGLLPMMLNLLAVVGVMLAPELAYVLKQFSHLLEASVDRFETPTASRTMSTAAPQFLTLLATSEIHSLALLTRALAMFREKHNRDMAAVEWDASGLLENVEFWLSGRRLLRERLLPLGWREMDWRNTKVAAGSGDYDNLLEQKVVHQLERVRDVLSEDVES